MINRRRFLTITSATLATGAQAAPVTRWQGHALGAEVSIALEGPRDATDRAITKTVEAIAHVEALFSLYRPSALVRLNKAGRLTRPHPDMLALFETISHLHASTDGLFDPTVQTLWDSASTDTQPDHSKIGWSQVSFDRAGIALGTGQKLTLNGIAQGYATDRVADVMRAAGLGEVLINIGEHLAQGKPRRLGLNDPTHGLLGHVTLQNAAIATSSPLATPIGHAGHIFSPTGKAPRWSTVCVIASNATLADGLSTALCLADDAQMKNARRMAGVQKIIRIDHAGDLTTL